MKTLLICLLAVGAFAAPRRVFLPYHLRRPHGMIVGGSNASPGEFPYQLSFQEPFLGGYFHFCGASIYDTTTGITAAHCVSGTTNNPDELYLVAGEHDMSTDEGTEQRRTVTSIVQHASYSALTHANDIAIVKITTPFVYDSYVANIALPASGTNYVGQTCTVTGWGTLTYGGSTPDILQKVDVPVVTDATCVNAYGSVSYRDDSNLCAGEAGKDSCQGDSGGPLACSGKLVGIVSYGYQCAVAGYPGVYTEASYYDSWVSNNS